MRHRAVLVAAAALMIVPLTAAPAAASHDDFGPGSVILSQIGAEGRVTAVFPPDADEDKIRGQVEAAAREGGIQLTQVKVAENTDPDTLRVIARTGLADRTGFLQRRIPRDRIEPWAQLAQEGQLYLKVNWPDEISGAERADDGYRLTGDSDVSYRIATWALIIPLLVLLCAAILPYFALRAYATTVVRRGGVAEDQLHRIRRAAVVAQMLVPLALVAALFLTGSIGWTELLLAEMAPGLTLPNAVRALIAMLSFMLPLLAAVVATAVAVVPFDRRLRGTDQTARQGAGVTVRAFALMFAPLLVWFVLLAMFPSAMRGWLLVPVLLVFALVLSSLQPLLLNRIMATRRPDATLRERVLSLCSDHGLRVRDVRILDSRGGKVANAAISGILPPLRFVYLTDHIIEILDDEEMDAILLHEIAHGKSHHLLIKLGASLATIGALALLVFAGGSDTLEWLARAGGMLAILFALPLVLVVVMLLVQGSLGVALEKHADDKAARVVGSAPLARALEKLADANKLKRRTGWLWNLLQQHPGMEQRIQRLNEDAGVHLPA